MISHSVFEFDFTHSLLDQELLVVGDLLNLCFVIEPVRLLGVERRDQAQLPVKLILIFVLRGSDWLLKDMLGVVPVVDNSGLRAIFELIKHLTDVLNSGLLVHLGKEFLTDFESLVIIVQIVIHEGHTSFHPVVVLFVDALLSCKLLGCNMLLRQGLVLVPAPFGFEEFQFDLVHVENLLS